MQSETGRAGKTVQVYFPDVGAFTDAGVADWSPEDMDLDYIDVVFDQHPGKAKLIRDFEQWQTAVSILDKLLDPAFKRGLEYFNGLIAGLITNANFNSNAIIVGATPGEVTVNDAATAWDTLATAKVPVRDTPNLSLFTHNTVHRKMLVDTAWSQENLVGAMIAQRAARRRTWVKPSTSPSAGTSSASRKPARRVTGTVSGSAASGTVTGSSTTFASGTAAQLVEVGDRVTIAGDTTLYTITAIASDTSLTVSPVLATAPSGAVMTQAGYTCLAMHKYAIALAVRPLELVNDGTVQSRIVKLMGIPFRVMVSYQHLKGGYLLTIDCGAAIQVIRPDFGVLIKV